MCGCLNHPGVTSQLGSVANIHEGPWKEVLSDAPVKEIILNEIAACHSYKDKLAQFRKSNKSTVELYINSKGAYLLTLHWIAAGDRYSEEKYFYLYCPICNRVSLSSIYSSDISL